MTDQSKGPPAAENPDLKAMHRDLIALVRRLELSVDAATTSGDIDAITQQIAEVNARVVAVGAVLFTRQTEEITRNAAAVARAVPLAEKEIDDLQDCERMVGSVTALLGTVDATIRTARLLRG